MMVPFVLLGIFTKPLQLKGFTPADSDRALTFVETALFEDSDVCHKDGTLSTKKAQPDKTLNRFSRFIKDMKALFSEKVFVVNILGYIAYNFVLGAYSYWGPKASYSIYNLENTDLIFGGATIVCGIFGTTAGGLVLDNMTSTIPNAFKLPSAATLFGGIFCFAAFWVKSFYVFLPLFAIGELLVFATQGPVNFVNLQCVKPSLRPMSMAISTCAIHIFGDVPSSPLVGVLQDQIDNWRVTTLILTAILFPSAFFWFLGIFLKSADKLEEENKDQVENSTTPLLDGVIDATTAASTEP